MYEGLVFDIHQHDGRKVRAVVIKELSWMDEKYAVIGYETEYPNTFIWQWKTLEAQLAFN